MNYALIKAGTVQNVIEADAIFAASIAHEWDAVIASETAGIGWAWDGVTFTAPVAPETPAPAPVPRHISVGAFYDRFGSAKYPILASTDPGVVAVIRDASVRKYIDLDRADLPAGIAVIQGAGFTVDAAAIIGAPVQPGELP